MMDAEKKRSRIMDILYENGETRKRSLSDMLELPLSTVTENLNKLREEDEVEKVKRGPHLQVYRVSTEAEEDDEDKIRPSGYVCDGCPYWDPVNGCWNNEEDANTCAYRIQEEICGHCYHDCDIAIKVSKISADCEDFEPADGEIAKQRELEEKNET